jgi:cell wall-associated NlpC family hydrolase
VRSAGRRLLPLVIAIALSALQAHASPGVEGAGSALALGEAGSGPAAPTDLGRSVAGSGAPAFSDVPASHWARAAIEQVAATNAWMADFDDGTFRPEELESRKLFARAMVLAFAPTATASPNITFTDLPPDDPFFPYASIAVRKRWMGKIDGGFRPDAGVRTVAVHRALVWALGLRDAALGLDGVATADGVALAHPRNLGALNIGMLLYLRHNHGTESMEVGPKSRLSRAEVAWSIDRADTVRTSETWRLADMAIFEAIQLPALDPAARSVLEFGLEYVGYPYVLAGDWNTKTPPGYCCGYQPVGGFDCSGLMWWLLKAPATYDNTFLRPYVGWPLLERSSRDMSLGVPKEDRLAYEEILPGDLLFYDGGGDGIVDHVNLYVGNGYALDSSGGVAGVTLMSIAEGWYRDHFTWARRLDTPAA